MIEKLLLDNRWQESRIIETAINSDVFLVSQKKVNDRIEVVFEYDTIADLVKFCFLSGKLEGVMIGKKIKENDENGVLSKTI
jgi:hypothetical protein